jgi:SH3-like domain-containing protein
MDAARQAPAPELILLLVSIGMAAATFCSREHSNWMHSPRWSRRWTAGMLAAVVALALAAPGAAVAEGALGPKSGLPLPRFVSLKPDRVNVRGGPTRDHEVAFVFTRAGMPVEIIAESDNWRRIRDWEGAEGWVYHAMLSGRRTAVVSPKDKNQLVPLRADAEADSEVVARVQAGVLASVKRCTGTWCRIAGTGFDGWVVQEQLWGVYPNEKVD